MDREETQKKERRKDRQRKWKYAKKGTGRKGVEDKSRGMCTHLFYNLSTGAFYVAYNPQHRSTKA